MSSKESKAAERRRLTEADMENTDMENEMVTPPKRRLDARGRVLRRERIFARLREGWTYDKIARDEGLTGARIGQIVREGVGDRLRREPHRLLEAGQPRLRPIRLLVEEALLEQVKTIAPLLDILPARPPPARRQGQTRLPRRGAQEPPGQA